jgi:hypothetical protein
MNNIIDIENPKTDILYGFFVGHLAPIEKHWEIAFYCNERARNRAMQYLKELYRQCDFITFEIKMAYLLGIGVSKVMLHKDSFRIRSKVEIAEIIKSMRKIGEK